jgi:hypothetical protein
MDIDSTAHGANGLNARNSPTLQLTKQIVFAFNQLKLCFFDRVDNLVEPNESNYVSSDSEW